MYVEGLVSVIIPTYKRSELLQKAIDSVLNQSYKNLELLVVNDNIVGDEYSKELYALISTYHDSRLHLVEQEKHINGAAARNAGIRQAKGEYIAFLDDDDYWELQKIERQVYKLSGLDKTWGAVTCLVRQYKNGELVMASLPYKSGNLLIDILDRNIGMGTGALLIRRISLDDAGYFDENLRRHQDLQLFARLASKYKILLDPVYLYNIEIKDNRNRPTTDELAKIKSDYFKSIQDIMDSLSEKNRKKIYIMHDFECAAAFIRSGEKKVGIKKALGVFKMPVTVGLAIRRIYKRFISTKFCHKLSKKYLLPADYAFETELKDMLLNMMKWFHQLCVENNIRYYAIGGTMLGAARHKGFIPWDDDIDVGIPRADYEKLIKVMEEAEPSRYILETPRTPAKDFFYTYSKIYDTQTTLVEHTKTNVKRGIFIDVFPLDGVGNTIKESEKHFKKVSWRSKLLITRTTALRKGRNPLKNAVVLLMRLIPAFALNNKKLQRKVDDICREYDFDQFKYGGNLLGHWGFKEIMPTEIMGTPTLYPFEDMQIFGVENYEQYLTNLYGNWRQLPPVEKQVSIHEFIEYDLKKSYFK